MFTLLKNLMLRIERNRCTAEQLHACLEAERELYRAVHAQLESIETPEQLIARINESVHSNRT